MARPEATVLQNFYYSARLATVATSHHITNALSNHTVPYSRQTDTELQPLSDHPLILIRRIAT